jgi:SNF2 family DNA or RNA helicase
MMIEKYKDRFLTPAYAHQLADTEKVVHEPRYALFSEMGTGKSKIVVDSACILKSEGMIDVVVVVAPAAVRSVWINKEFGEIRKHSWLKNHVVEYHAKSTEWYDGSKPDNVIQSNGRLMWIVTNYEFLRSSVRLKKLIDILHNMRFMLVLDESSFIKSRMAMQTKAVTKLGQLAARKLILNGTPIANNPLDVWSQMNFLDRRILPYENFSAFRAEFAVMDQKVSSFPKIIGWRNLDKLQGEVGPYVVRREKKDCLDLPEKIYSQVEVPLDEPTWKMYKEMRNEAIVFMDENPTMATEAGVKMMRLSQITGGILGGFKPESDAVSPGEMVTKFVSREKLDFLRGWVEECLQERPTRKIIVWCRFRYELERVAADLSDLLPTFRIYGQGKAERDKSVEFFSKIDDKPGLLAAQVQAGGFGLNLVGADTVAYLSNDFNLMTRLQSEDRVHRPGQRNCVTVLDILATGPKGQKTRDHYVVDAVQKKKDLAQWTTSAWKQVLQQEAAEE